MLKLVRNFIWFEVEKKIVDFSEKVFTIEFSSFIIKLGYLV